MSLASGLRTNKPGASGSRFALSFHALAEKRRALNYFTLFSLTFHEYS